MIRVFEGAADLDLPLPRASRVAVKPNLTATRPRPGVTTTPALLERVVRLLLDHGNRVVVVESDGGYGAYSCEQAFEGHGIPAMCQRLGASAVNLSASPARALEVDTGRGRLVIPFPALLLDDVDAFVTMP